MRLVSFCVCVCACVGMENVRVCDVSTVVTVSSLISSVPTILTTTILTTT